MKAADLYRSKLGLFFIQVLILTLFITVFQYKFFVDFDSGILPERRFAIQVLANYVMYEWDGSLLFMYGIWLLVAIIPVIILKETRKVVIMNMITFFIPNYFFYVFLIKYSSENYTSILILKTLLLGLIIASFSILLTIILKLIKNLRKEVTMQDVSLIEQQTKSKCPYCGTEFNSIPVYCYNCNRKLIPNLEDKNGESE